MHGDTLEVRVDGGEQADDFNFATLLQNVEGPCAVFAAAPGEKDLGFQGISSESSVRRFTTLKVRSLQIKFKLL